MAELEIKHLSKSFGEHKVLDDICLSIERGDIYGILGLSGAGKSTLVRCINGLETFDEGEINYQGRLLCAPKHPIDRKDRTEIAMIFQGFNLLQQKTALQNVMFALDINKTPKKDRKSIALEALKRVGLENEVNKYPSQLSGGQAQRVAIARALVLNPKIILSDEATSALDPETTHSILQLLKSLAEERNITIVMISHQMNAIEEICNKVAIIDSAKIVESGPLEEVFLSPKTEIAKRIVFVNAVHTTFKEGSFIRILFDGNADDPIISRIVSEAGIQVSIVYADTKTVEGKVYGQTVIKRPSEDKDVTRLKKFLELADIKYEEVDNL